MLSTQKVLQCALLICKVMQDARDIGMSPFQNKLKKVKYQVGIHSMSLWRRPTGTYGARMYPLPGVKKNRGNIPENRALTE